MNDDRTNELQRRLRASLAERADDVEPTPALWAKVESRARRDRFRTWLVGGLAAAAALVGAVLVVPALLQQPEPPPVIAPVPSDEGTATPTETTPPAATEEPVQTETEQEVGSTVGPEHALVVVGDRIELVSLIGGIGGGAMVDFTSEENESTITSVVVRPGSTLEDLTAVWTSVGEGQVWMGWFRLLDGEVTFELIDDPAYAVSPDVVVDAVPTPAFSPDGRHLAWIEVLRGEENQSPVLRTIGWTDDGPGTGDPADDNASFVLDDLSVEFPGGWTIDDWSFEERPGGADDPTARGTLWVTNGAFEAFSITVERQGDGALALPAGAVSLLEMPGAALLDVAVGDAQESPEVAVRYRHDLTVAGEGAQDAEDVTFRLVRTVTAEDTEETTEVELPELGPTASPGDTWMTAWQEVVLLGRPGAGAWADTGRGFTPLPDGTTYAAPVR
ncbi:MAG: hypothetical protein ACLGIR_03870 [Actinomycetes bacterium]